MRRATLIGLAILSAGCASASRTYGPDGREAFSLNCSGWARNWGMCYEKAGELCGPKGYTIVGGSGEQSMMAAGQRFGTAAGFSVTPLLYRNLLVQCNP